MNDSLFLRGLVMGVSIAAPVGPIGVLCIRRTLADGWAYGLLSGLGAATADAIYGCIAGLGLTVISAFLVSQQQWLRLIGGIFLCYLGIRTLLSRPNGEAVADGVTASGSLLAAYGSTLLLTLTNPITILSFAAIFAGLGMASAESDYGSAVMLVLGVFAGSAAWWLLLSSAVGLFRARFRPRLMLWVNRASGLVILAFGLFALVSLIGQR